MNTLSVCMIARDEEATIAEALGSLFYDRKDAPAHLPRNEKGQAPIWDELIVVLAGESHDHTREIAQGFEAKIGIYPAPDGRWPVDANGQELRHYGDAREATEALATGDYVLWIDADERLIEGHELIRGVVEQGVLQGVRPHIRPLMNPNISQARQELLHKRGYFKWVGAIHERLKGAPCPVEPRILYDEIPRPGGDRPHGDMYELLRRDMGTRLDQRQLFYIGREHLMDGHYAEAIAVLRLFIEADGGWPERRSQVQTFIGQAWSNLDDPYQARLAYLEAIKEWGNWAEPYYGLALVHRDIGMFREAIAWASAACIFEPGEDSEVFNREIYEWRRFDIMAYCLAQIGRYDQAAAYYEKVARAHPNHTTEANLRRVRGRLKEAVA